MADVLPTRGRLDTGADAPPHGERTTALATFGGVRVDQILSGVLDAPVEYDQPFDEWVVVLAGRAELEVNVESHELRAGDWFLLPAHVPHRLLRTEPGTSWITVRAQEHEPGTGR